MLLLRFGKWNSAFGKYFKWERIYIRIGTAYNSLYLFWTPFCKVTKRKLKEDKEDKEDIKKIEKQLGPKFNEKYKLLEKHKK